MLEKIQGFLSVIGMLAVLWVIYRSLTFIVHLYREASHAKQQAAITVEVPEEVKEVKETREPEHSHAEFMTNDSEKPFAKLGINVLDKNFHPEMYKEVENKAEMLKKMKSDVQKLSKKVFAKHEISEDNLPVIVEELQRLVREMSESSTVSSETSAKGYSFLFLIPDEDFEEPITIKTFVAK